MRAYFKSPRVFEGTHFKKGEHTISKEHADHWHFQAGVASGKIEIVSGDFKVIKAKSPRSGSLAVTKRVADKKVKDQKKRESDEALIAVNKAKADAIMEKQKAKLEARKKANREFELKKDQAKLPDELKDKPKGDKKDD